MEKKAGIWEKSGGRYEEIAVGCVCDVSNGGFPAVR